MGIAEIAQSHATTIGVLANRCEPDQLDDVCEQLARLELPSWALPETPLLSAPILGDLMTALDGALLLGDEDRTSVVSGKSVAVRGDLGGRGTIKTKKKNNIQTKQ